MRIAIRSVLPVVALLHPWNVIAQTQAPIDLAEVESDRSRACVARLAALEDFEASLAPYVSRANRLNALGRAITLEKRQDAEPFDGGDPVEASVSQWFSSDSLLASRFLQEGDSTVLTQRGEERAQILERVRQSIRDIQTEAQAVLDGGADVQAAAEPCVGVILIRSAVLEECGGDESSQVCQAAASEEREGSFVFVEAPDDLWGVEEYGPWADPAPIQFGPNGELVGASTSTRARIGNVVIRVTLRPLLHERSDLSEEEYAQYRANLDSLGVTFDHPSFAMAPGIDIQGTLPPPLGGETHYLLHFGDLSGDDIIWSMEAAEGGPIRAVFPARSRDLARLRAGELVSFTAIRAPDEEGGDADAVFSLSLLQVGQGTKVGLLLDYFMDGTFDRDLKALFPVGSGG